MWEGSRGVGRESGCGKGVGVLGGSQGVGREQGCRDILHLYVVQPVCCFKLG